MNESKWIKFIPWFMTITSTIVMLSIGYFLIENMNWFKNISEKPGFEYTELYQIHIFHLFISTLKRLIGFFASFCLIFIGTGASIYAMKQASSMTGESKDFKISLITTSPRIIAMVLGVILMSITIINKDSFPDFDGDKYVQKADAKVHIGS
ncbi:MAG: hypothetical protein WC799_25015, partial [Desulfobacteraceae bacterium]